MAADWITSPATQVGSPDPNVFSQIVYYGPWAGRPTAASCPQAQMIITDYGVGGRSYWFSDGTYWRPKNGRVLLAQVHGSFSTPVATAGPGAFINFILSSVNKIPAGMIFPGCKVGLAAKILRVGTVGASTGIRATLSNSNTYTPTNDFLFTTLGNTAGYNVNFWGAADWSSLNSFVTSTYMTPNGAGTGGFSDQTGVNGANDVYVNIGADSLPSDSMSLQNYSIWIEG